MSPPLNPNSEWCRAIAATLVALGLRDVVTSPGTRSAALVSALAEQASCRLHVLTDERSAGFFALGLMRSTGRAVAVCVTSGSAVANLMPALAEAHAGALPLVALTCDRPKAFRGSGQPQTTPQAEFCRPLLAELVDLDDPSSDPDARRAMVDCLAALGALLDPRGARGPVQINIPLLGRMTSVDGVHGWDHAAPLAPTRRTPLPAQDVAAPGDAAAIIDRFGLRPGLRGLIVVGPDEAMPVAAIRAMAAATGFPLLADAPGGLRGAGITDLIAEGDFLVTRRDFVTARPDVMIRFGPAPVSSSVQQYVATCDAPVIHVERIARARDYLTSGRASLHVDDGATLAALAQAMAPGDAGWKARWTAAAARCRAALTDLAGRLDWSEAAAAHAALSRPFAMVHLANSLSLRIANMLIGASTDGQAVHCNRGVSGIDGTIGTFLGELAGTQGRGLLLIGDLAAAHDVSSLEAAAGIAGRGGVILLLNNAGGGLFDLLPVRTVPQYRTLIRHVTRIDFGHLAAAYGLPFARVGSDAELIAALDAAERSGGIHLIEAVFAPGAIRHTLSTLVMDLARIQDKTISCH